MFDLKKNIKMKKIIANIITKSNKIDFDFNYNKCKSMEEIDISLPTFIIGYENAKKFIRDFDILKKSYPEQNIWWTFLKTEKRVDYDNDIKNFNDIIIKKIIEKVKYQLCDIITMDKNDKKKLWDFILSDNKKVIYNDFNKFLFIYDKENNVVLGLSLSTCRFCGVDTKSLCEKIFSISSNKEIIDFNIIPTVVKKNIQTDVHNLLALYEYFE